MLMLSYAVIRFAMEFLRGDNPPIYFGLTLSQTISLVIATVAISFLVSRKSAPPLEALETVG
jgi:prolipoprotein diacylglyceryltransferase